LTLLISLALWMSGLAQLMVEAKNIGSSRNSEGEMVWIVVERAPAPDMPYWSGRRWLAAIDAIAWPLGLGLLLGRGPGKTGLMLPMASAVLLLWGLSRFHKAVWLNHRYRFTTWWVLGILAVLVIVGLVLKIALR
jgi:hypothetical protein